MCFIGEPAVDTRGLSREFWRLLMLEVNNTFCVGGDEAKVFVHDVPAIQVAIKWKLQIAIL